MPVRLHFPEIVRRRWLAGAVAVGGLSVVLAFVVPGTTFATSAGTNVRVTHDASAAYVSADALGGTGAYTDGTLARCGVDRRQQNEPTLAIDPRNPDVWISGSNDYCTIPTNGDAWTGYYRSTDAGQTWTDSLLPGYPADTSPQAANSPLHALTKKGSFAAGDPAQAWDTQGRAFYMGNNFDRGIANGGSFRTRQNFGAIWVSTYAPSNPSDFSTDGARFVRTVLLATNTPGNGSFNDKTGLAVDPATGDIYAAWSEFHGSGCNEIDFARSTNHGVSFSAPVKVSGGICGNQGPSFAIGPNGQVYLAWEGTSGGSFGQNGVNGAALIVSTNHGATFSKARLAVTYPPFVSEAFSGNGARECGDAPLDCPSGQTFPRFDLAGPYLAADNVNGTLVMAFQAATPSGQGQIQYSFSTNGGGHWSSPAALAPAATGHQYYPYLTASGGRVSAVWYDSQNDPAYAATRAPCNDENGVGSECINVRYASSDDGGKTWNDSIQVTDITEPTNPNFEQFGGRLVPFFGDYITVAAVGDTIGAVWTDQRDTVAADSDADEDADGNDVAGDPHVGGDCTSVFDTCFDGTGGEDQNIYGATITP
jgi:hypothetical protein